jgi:hypothetical protein
MLRLSLSDEVLAEIGKIAVVFGLIEDSLAKIIGRIITVAAGGHRPELGTIVTAELSFKQRIGMLDSLLLFVLGKDHEVVQQLICLKPELFKAEESRNRVLHSTWANQTDSQDPHGVVRMKSTAKQRWGLRRDWEEMGLEELRQVSDVVGHAYGQLCLFELHFREELDDAESSGG